MMRPALFAVLLAAFASVSPARADQSPPLPDAVIDLRTTEGASLLAARWRYADARIVEAPRPARPGRPAPDDGPPAHDVYPRIDGPGFESAPWQPVTPESLEERRSDGRLAFAWYRLDLTIPPEINGFATAGSTLVLDLTVDDYAEIWLDDALPQVLGQAGGHLISGWNTPNRVTVARGVNPGQQIRLAVFAINGPLSAPPANFIWIRSATLNFYGPGHEPGAPKTVPVEITRLDPALDAIVPPQARAERLADGFAFTEGPVWVPQLPAGRTYGGGGPGGYLLFSDPNRNVIHRWDPTSGDVSIFRSVSGYAGTGGPNIGEYHQPGSNGLVLSPDGRLTICEHGNRRITRLEPSGALTVLADRFNGRRLNSPNDLVYRSDGALFFTDPPFGLPNVYDDRRKQLPFSGVFCLYNGTLRAAATDLRGPNGLALSPDEAYLYVGNWDPDRKVIVRYDVGPDATLSNPTTLVDLTATDPGELCFDGLKVDRRGNIYAAGPGGLRIYSARGVQLGTIRLPEQPANFAFDQDGADLYITARTGLYRLRLQPPRKP